MLRICSKRLLYAGSKTIPTTPTQWFATASATHSVGVGEIVAQKGSAEMLKSRLPLTKIVATIGPASEHMPMLGQVVDAGMRIMRINFSHATYDEADLRVRNLNNCYGVNHAKDKEQGSASPSGYANMRAVMLDTQGPEIRIGSFAQGEGVNKKVEMAVGQKVTITTDPNVRNAQTNSLIWVSYDKIHSTVQTGSTILLDDGAVELQVESKSSKNGEVYCRVANSGIVGNKKGVNLPGLKVDLPAMSDKDKEDIRWGIKNNVDYIAASFIRKASDVEEIREYCHALRRELNSADALQPVPMIISKIESVEALQNFDEVLASSDAIMVARGDLAVEIPMETLANVQKEIVHRCNNAGKPVIVATQMLESMQKNPRPTRAECTDIANALIDGADCVMLSGESAQGMYPEESVGLMNRIIHQTELAAAEKSTATVAEINPSTDAATAAFARAAVETSTVLNRSNKPLACIVAMPSAGNELVQAIASYKAHVPTLCIVSSYKTGRQLQLNRGLHPVFMPEKEVKKDAVLSHLRSLGLVKDEDQVLLLSRCSASCELTMQLSTVA